MLIISFWTSSWPPGDRLGPTQGARPLAEAESTVSRFWCFRARMRPVQRFSRSPNQDSKTYTTVWWPLWATPCLLWVSPRQESTVQTRRTGCRLRWFPEQSLNKTNDLKKYRFVMAIHNFIRKWQNTVNCGVLLTIGTIRCRNIYHLFLRKGWTDAISR